MIRRLLLALAFALPALAGDYEVFAIRYATLPQFPVAGLVQGAEGDRKLDIAMMVWLIRGGGRNVLVDSGFYRPQFFEKWNVEGFLRPDAAVALAGVTPEDVTDVILTHAHWDHVDGADLFPKAQLWIQKDEYAYYTGAAWQSGGQHGGIEPEDMRFLLNANLEGRLHLVDGDQEILPGIRVHTGGRHTFASQYVSVDAKPGPIVLASDNLYLYENLEKHAPIAQTFDAKSNLAAQEKMKALGKIIVPGHDPAVMTKFSLVRERVVAIK